MTAGINCKQAGHWVIECPSSFPYNESIQHTISKKNKTILSTAKVMYMTYALQVLIYDCFV